MSCRCWQIQQFPAINLIFIHKISATVEVKEVQKAGVGVALGDEKKGFAFSIFPEGKIVLDYWERFPNHKVKYWEVWHNNVQAPQTPFLIKLEYQCLPPEIKGYIDDDLVVSMDLEGNPVCEAPHSINKCGVRIAGTNGTSGGKAIFSYLTVEER